MHRRDSGTLDREAVILPPISWGHMTSTVFLETAPFLLVDDVVKAAQYYRDVLGFELGRYYGDPPGFVIVRRNAARIMLRQVPAGGRPALLTNTSKMRHAFDLYVWVSDVDTLAGELRKRGANIVHEPQTEDGRREMQVKDLEGYVICPPLSSRSAVVVAKHFSTFMT